MNGPLTCIEALTFVDGTMQPGERVTQREPTDLERKGSGQFVGGLESDAESDQKRGNPPCRWIVVEWNGKRRRVPSRAFETLEGK